MIQKSSCSVLIMCLSFLWVLWVSSAQLSHVELTFWKLMTTRFGERCICFLTLTQSSIKKENFWYLRARIVYDWESHMIEKTLPHTVVTICLKKGAIHSKLQIWESFTIQDHHAYHLGLDHRLLLNLSFYIRKKIGFTKEVHLNHLTHLETRASFAELGCK